MPSSYTRQSSFSNGDVIDAPLFNAEFNQLVAAFHEATGHNHDGTAAGGSAVPFIQKDTSGVYIDTTTDPMNPTISFRINGVEVSSMDSTFFADSTSLSHTPTGGTQQTLNTYLDGLEVAVGDASADAATATAAAALAQAAASSVGIPIILSDGAVYNILDSSVLLDIICLGNATINLPSNLTVGHRYSIRVSSKATSDKRCTIVNPTFNIIGDILTMAPGDELELKPRELVILDTLSTTELEII